jgi:hypothetical protein
MIKGGVRCFVVMTLAATAGCASSATTVGRPSIQPPTTATTATTASTAAGASQIAPPPTCAALIDLLVEAGPRGFAEFPSVGGPPCNDVAAASTIEGPAYAHFLRANGFVREAERSWLDGTRTNLVDIHLYQFHAESGAVAHSARAWAKALEEQKAGRPIAVPGVPDAKALMATTGRLTAIIVVGHAGPLSVVIGCSDVHQAVAMRRAVEYARKQYGRL